MTLMFLVLFPLSRSARHLLAHNYNLAMSLHVALGLGYFFDSFRRRSHPHVWLYNTPALLLYIGDRAVAASVYVQKSESKSGNHRILVTVLAFDSPLRELALISSFAHSVLRAASGNFSIRVTILTFASPARELALISSLAHSLAGICTPRIL